MMHLQPVKKVSCITNCGETSEAHPVRGRGLRCPVQRLVREVNMFPWEHMKTSHRVMWILDPSPQDVSCLRTVYIMRYGLRVCHVTGHDYAPKAWGPRNVLCPPWIRREYILITYATLSVQHWTHMHHFRDKCWCMIIYLSYSAGTLTIRTSHEDECDFCHRLHVCQLYLANLFFWWGWIGLLIDITSYNHITWRN
jgi:hypothetical protein